MKDLDTLLSHLILLSLCRMIVVYFQISPANIVYVGYSAGVLAVLFWPYGVENEDTYETLFGEIKKIYVWDGMLCVASCVFLYLNHFS